MLFILTCVLGYVTLLEETPQDTAYNTKRYPGRMRLRPAQMGRGSGGQRPPEAGRLPSPTAPAAWQSQPLCCLCRGHGTAPAWPAAHAALALVGAEDVAQRLWGGAPVSSTGGGFSSATQHSRRHQTVLQVSSVLTPSAGLPASPFRPQAPVQVTPHWF